ncbi:hypothetical protein Pmani_034057 [Petrolisthes manimaculis]|uniref:Major facilitator superfamily (MFS) profile domain-containing protein n=1 Tax=Petrolisthes manimaculis TaxID=1843537 RepID=A0AAE1TPJ2_9EUCA|nr:hypothetical protein Pmani_034057 [Petrolisthes manimaculis]
MAEAQKNTCCAKVPARLSLAFLTSAGVTILYILRINMSVAIVAMVDLAPESHNSSKGTHVAYCISSAQVNETMSMDYDQLDDLSTTLPPTDMEEEENTKMVLTGAQRGLVLGAFFYGYAITNIPGGRMAETYGSKRVYGGAILIGGILTLLTPVAANAHYIVLILLRTLIGLSNGVVYPAMNAMVARWIPPLERPRFMSFTYMSNTLGTVITMPVCGFLIAWVGWPSVFYFSGTVAILWSILWFLFMFDTPAQHPRISPQERDYIIQALKAETKKEKGIITSVPLWATNFAHIGSMFGFNLLLTQLPTYLATILGFAIANNGMLSALPFVTQFIGSIVSGWVGDYLITRNYITVRTSRKTFVTITHVLPAIVLVLVGYSGCQTILAIALLCVATTFSGCLCSGHLANHLDLSPNFAGTLYGVSNTLAFLVTMCVPVIVGAMTPDQTLQQWQAVFWVAGAAYVSCWFIFVLFGSTDIQPWNYGDEEEVKGGQGEDGEAMKEVEKEETEKFIGDAKDSGGK